MGWEYQTLQFDFSQAMFNQGGLFNSAYFRNELNRLGWDGWELVNVFDTNRHSGGTRFIVAVFKRPLTEQRREEIKGT